MIIINDLLVSDDVVKKEFICNLDACKGACCWEGDFGAPLEDAELEILEAEYDKIAPYLTEEGKAAIKSQGKFVYNEKPEEYGTTLIKNGACAYMTLDERGKAKCGIEQAHQEGKTDFLKPISCHLYPIRVTVNEKTDFEALNYDHWEICSAACELGKKHEMPVYQFVKNALVRKYGQAFYDELDAAAQYIQGKSSEIE